MQLLTIAAVVAGVIAIVVFLIIAVKKVSTFYKQRFQFSIWSGVLLLVMALASLLISTTDGVTQQMIYITSGVSFILAALTIYNDIRLAGFVWGCIAILLQIVFSLSFVLLIFLALLGVVMKKLFNIHNALLASIFDGLGLKKELLLLVHFLRP